MSTDSIRELRPTRPVSLKTAKALGRANEVIEQVELGESI
jgi:hypothetical protein